MQVAPLYAELAAERPDAIFAEVDVDENPVRGYFGCPAPVAVGQCQSDTGSPSQACNWLFQLRKRSPFSRFCFLLQELAAAANVVGTPTFLVFADTKPVRTPCHCLGVVLLLHFYTTG